MGVRILRGMDMKRNRPLYWVVGEKRHGEAADGPGGDLAALPVASVEEVQPTRGQVYDFSVEGDENFIAGIGGICCHNTDADVRPEERRGGKRRRGERRP